MSFEDFLDCMSVFSEAATRDVKASYAFRLYGWFLSYFLFNRVLWKRFDFTFKKTCLSSKLYLSLYAPG